jgi:transcription elongation factor GreA
MANRQMTPEGLQELKKELEQHKDRKGEIAEKIKFAKEQGDLKENSEYQEALNDMQFNERRIAELEDLVRNAEVIEHTEKSNYVTLGSRIKVKGKVGEREFRMVGASEADPTQGKISNESPLGSAFMHRKAGEQFEVETPGGKSTYQILEILE